MQNRTPPRSSPPKDNPTGWRPALINLSWLMVWLLIMVFTMTRMPERPEAVPYSEFLTQVESGQVATVKISEHEIEYTLISVDTSLNDEAATQPEVATTTPLPADPDLSRILRQHDVEITALPTNGRWVGGLWSLLFPLLIVWILWGSFANRMQAGPAALSVGKSKARIYSQSGNSVTFDDVAGVDEAKVELQEIVDFLKDSKKYTRLGAKIPKGVLLVGPPGTGKTLLARAIAGEAGVPFFSISASEFIEMFVGVGASRVRDLFEQAKQQAPCIVFIDELDALGKSRTANGPFASNDEREQTLNQLLAEMDGFEPNAGVILLAATNRPEVLDPALLRAGRFDRRIVVDRPDRQGRKAILDVHAKTVQLSDDVVLSKLAARTPGFAGADLANLINEAALLAARKNREAVTMADFNEAIERMLTGLEKKSRILSELEKQTVAYHEAGHAIIGALMPGTGSIEKISIVPRGVAALGYTLQLPEDDRFLMMEDEIRGQLMMLLGGRAAEELIFNKVSTGASDDIQKATDLAERCITLYGMSKTLGPMAVERNQAQFLDGFGQPRRPISPHLAETIDGEIKELIDHAYQMATALLARNQAVLERIAQKLLTAESLEGDTLKTLLADIQPLTDVHAWLNPGHQGLQPYLPKERHYETTY
ncbi:ATP-dependent metallopeptidase FtsH/Yme1/Tma family protein [Leptolyngbyaceae cyanobacterium CCMR0082]|uniref:ATP-dependent zinc metalloprotease FtsH n=1 Tax=Adonisia turfae CCMR0082 TaxID=2304604 RepID=A0A6M0RYV1_9CYAN|nr:ATP-dependent zinc metalloprotease FtsH [Adonisia turfae]NEZ61336.1 ATP-dependent metallopeptidase FtsH/Yme1/Tma family protein [Adonisia turfae CCMR0082]